MQAVVSLLPLLPRAFPEEGAYLRYCEDYVGACLSALAVAVGRDLLWKPLNHKILLLTRDPKKAVRVAAVKVLHRLFSEVRGGTAVIVIVIVMVVSSCICCCCCFVVWFDAFCVQTVPLVNSSAAMAESMSQAFNSNF